MFSIYQHGPNTLVIKIFYLQVTLSLSTVPAYNCEHLFQVSVISSRWVFTLLDTNSMHSNMLLRSTYMVQQYNIVIRELEKLVNTKHILPNYHALTADRPVCCCAVTFEISSSELQNQVPALDVAVFSRRDKFQQWR